MKANYISAQANISENKKLHALLYCYNFIMELFFVWIFNLYLISRSEG